MPAHHTSQTCPSCDHVDKENRKSQAHFECVACGYQNNADVVGAIKQK
ncbi:zinc ribbon domain-containing protein [Shewanella psychromarinicola]